MKHDSEAGAYGYLKLDDQALLQFCEVDNYRSQGPGGQKRNKTDSAVRLRHKPTGIMVTAVEDRSQHVNKARALKRLRVALALDLRCSVDADRYETSALMKSYASEKLGIRVSSANEEYPLIIAEVVDLFVACELRPPVTAERLGISTGQLIKFLSKEEAVWRKIQELRQAAGLTQIRHSGS